MRLTSDTLRGIWAGVTLPWNEDYSLDEQSLRENLRRLVDARVHGIYTTGSTGEFYALDMSEFRQVVDIVTQVVCPTGTPVQIGCCSDDTRDILRQMEYAVSKGVDGLQFALPYWMELTDRAVLHFFEDVSTAFPDTPLTHYNIPRAKRFLTGEMYSIILELVPNLIGVKFTFAGSHFGDLQSSIHKTPQLAYFVSENLLVTGMQLGARGSCSSIVCMNPGFMLNMFSLAEQKEWQKALEMQERVVSFTNDLAPLMEQFGLGGIDPVVDKGLAVASGFLVGHQRTRAPYIGWSDEGVQAVRTWLQEEYPDLTS